MSDESELTRWRHGERVDWKQRYRNWASKVWADAHNFVTRYRSQTDVALAERDELRALLLALYDYAGGPSYELPGGKGLVPGMDRGTLGDVFAALWPEGKAK